MAKNTELRSPLYNYSTTPPPPIPSSPSELLGFLVFLFFVSVPCARLSWPSRQLLSTRK